MDLGYRAEDILWLVEHGLLTLGYQSSSYLTERVPELGVLDLPFLFPNERPRAAPSTARSARSLAGQDRGARATASSVGSRTGFGICRIGCGQCTGRRT